jgi:hypothetical protein
MRILRGLSSRILPCGCVAGIYETYDAQTVTIVDVPAESCSNREHRSGKVVPVESSTATRGARGDA